MGFFTNIRKRKEEPIEITSPPHKHVWKDLPWYIECGYSDRSQSGYIRIIEPYICITCGERKNITLESYNWESISKVVFEKNLSQLEHEYKKYLKPRAIVEDMIYNIKYVKDAGYLNMVEKTLGTPHQNCGTSSFSSYTTTNPNYCIKIKKN